MFVPLSYQKVFYYQREMNMKARFIRFVLMSVLLPMTLHARKEKPVVEFGVVTDVHYNRNQEMRINRYYRDSDEKLREAVDTFNAHRVDFTVVLGDLIDGDLDSYADLQPIFSSLKKPVYKVFGNHDFLDCYGTPLETDVQEAMGMKTPYYCVQKRGIRFLFLDSNDLAVHSRSEQTPEGREARALLEELKERHCNYAYDFNGTLGKVQREWLLSQIKQAEKKGQTVICLAHMPLQPMDIGACDFRGKEVSDLLESFSCVKAFLAGHHHKGSRMLSGRLKHYGFQGMIEGKENHFAIVKIYKDRMEIIGFGQQESRTIGFE